MKAMFRPHPVLSIGEAINESEITETRTVQKSSLSSPYGQTISPAPPTDTQSNAPVRIYIGSFFEQIPSDFG